MKSDQFMPSFCHRIWNFETITKCGACACFEKVTAHGLCQLCYFYAKYGMHDRLIKHKYTVPEQIKPEFEDMLDWLAKKVCGIDTLRENQRTAIKAYTSKKNTLVVMPTGYGKSLCFWISAILYGGLTVVLEPLIALMQDQMVSKLIIDVLPIHVGILTFHAKSDTLDCMWHTLWFYLCINNPGKISSREGD
jgi:hypothetical protein